MSCPCEISTARVMIVTEFDEMYVVYLVNNVTEQVLARFEARDDMIEYLWQLCAETSFC